MHKYLLWILSIIIALLSGCARPTGEINANLGENISLAIGQAASISGENLKVRFIEVIGDSRCPEGVECFWAGEASSQIEITYSNITYQKVLTQPGLSGPAQTDFLKYKITFNLKPYPQERSKIENKDYRLQISIGTKAD